MAGYLARRIVGALLVMWAVATLVFFMMRAVPGDPLAAMMFDSGDPGDDSFGGTIPRSTMKPVARTAGFVDRIGLAYFSGSFSARKDAAEAERLRKGLNVLLAKIPRPIEPEPAKPAPDPKDQPEK